MVRVIRIRRKEQIRDPALGTFVRRDVRSECNFWRVAPRKIVSAMLDRAVPGGTGRAQDIVRRLDCAFYTDPVDATLKPLAP